MWGTIRLSIVIYPNECKVIIKRNNCKKFSYNFRIKIVLMHFLIWNTSRNKRVWYTYFEICDKDLKLLYILWSEYSTKMPNYYTYLKPVIVTLRFLSPVSFRNFSWSLKNGKNGGKIEIGLIQYAWKSTLLSLQQRYSINIRPLHV